MLVWCQCGGGGCCGVGMVLRMWCRGYVEDMQWWCWGGVGVLVCCWGGFVVLPPYGPNIRLPIA